MLETFKTFLNPAKGHDLRIPRIKEIDKRPFEVKGRVAFASVTSVASRGA